MLTILGGLFCKHNWKIISENEIDEDFSDGWKHTYTRWQTVKIIIVTCKKCGNLKKIKLR